ncbi:MAG: hypothetical protein EHM48_00210 [Planctomycetaceae bacterium]|nr:MAG: hypothetical protein EHM48_00210 [Planctomycetaceae bacterium]
MMKKVILLTMAMAGLAGCAVTQDQNTPVSQHHQTEPSTKKGFYIYVPSTYRREKPAPLIVTCHGTPPYDIAEHHIREWKAIGEANGCIIIAPELVGTDGIFGDGPTSAMLEDERRILSIISTLGYQYNIDMANVMITGFSGGGFPAYWVGLRHPDLFSVIVARNCNFSEHNLAGWYPAEAVNTPIFVYWGDNDPGAIKNQSQNAITYLRSMGFSVETRELPNTGHERHPEVAMEFFRSHMKQPRSSLPVEGQK